MWLELKNEKNTKHSNPCCFSNSWGHFGIGLSLKNRGMVWLAESWEVLLMCWKQPENMNVNICCTALKISSVNRAYILKKCLYFLPLTVLLLTWRCLPLEDTFSGAFRTLWHTAQILFLFLLLSISRLYILFFHIPSRRYWRKIF